MTITGLDPGREYEFQVWPLNEWTLFWGNHAIVWATAAQADSGPAAIDRAALIALYNATDGNNWTNTLSGERRWLVNDPNSNIADWYGVTTDSNGRVTQLQLYRNGLTGTIPASLGQLSQLTVLSLYRNPGLSGSIPPELGNLSNLEELHLYRNDLSGEIPTSLWKLTGLTSLNLAVNR